jgi:hypothetical protein
MKQTPSNSCPEYGVCGWEDVLLVGLGNVEYTQCGAKCQPMQLGESKTIWKVRLLAKQDKYDFVNFTSRIFQQEVWNNAT